MEDFSGLVIVLFYVMIIIMFVLMLEPAISWLLYFLQNKKKSFIEKADDAHVALYRKRKKSSIQNIKGTRLKYLVLMGDDDYYDNDRFARIRGVYWKNEIVECFAQTRRLRPWIWLKIPKELVRDALGTNLRIAANGVEPLGNFYKPIYTKHVLGRTVQVRTSNPGIVEIPLSQYYDHQILDHEEYLLDIEKAIETEEQKVHLMIDAVDSKRQARGLIHRPDYATAIPGQPEEGEQYERE